MHVMEQFRTKLAARFARVELVSLGLSRRQKIRRNIKTEKNFWMVEVNL